MISSEMKIAILMRDGESEKMVGYHQDGLCCMTGMVLFCCRLLWHGHDMVNDSLHLKKSQVNMDFCDESRQNGMGLGLRVVKGGLEEVSEEEEVVPVDLHEDVLVVIQRPQRTRILAARVEDFKIIAYNEVIKDRYLVHFSLLVDAEPINHNEALNSESWNNVMVEELTSL
ncbi:hypothetical protein KIW84_023659 [Lathyrus oleraceus]|uniref:Uncharacterized protein n=1 Tax=Pisum sativum TaxID=3888 RepID=A0A9D4YDI9_PEA|nr:hypothetical protein KIW84_023659 [Pisum sativum]